MRALSWLLAVTAAANAAVDFYALALHLAGDLPDESFGVAVRTAWALLRSIGFLILIWHLRAGRATAWPLAIVLSVTTIFGVGRIAPLRGEWDANSQALVGSFVTVGLLCVAILLLFRSEQVKAHLARRPSKWNTPSWVVTARVMALSYTALLLVPCLVAVGTLFGDRRVGLVYAAPLVVGWLVLALAVNWVIPLATMFLRRRRQWARTLVLALTLVVLVVQPVLCLLLLGIDGLLRDAAPLVIAAALVLYGLAGDPSARAYFTSR